jgi:hypothetical protein
MAYAVLMPERFRGCCPFGATYRCFKAVNSPARPFQQRPDYSVNRCRGPGAAERVRRGMGASR